jgi:hypothetical protein
MDGTIAGGGSRKPAVGLVPRLRQLMSAKVLSPVTVTFEDGESDRYSSVEDLGCNLEFFDSDADNRCSVVDDHGRPVRLKIRSLELQELRLLSPMAQ